jgi:uncharacterized membrane protein YcaP (DUF421 family)
VELVIRASVIYWFLWVVVRGTGKRALADMSPLDLLILVIIGDLVQQGTTASDMSIVGAMIVISVLLLWAFAADWVSQRSRKVEKALMGEPVVIVHDGKIIAKRARRERLSDEDVASAAREQGIGHIASIRFGVMEPDGKFSFITRDVPPEPDSSGQTADRSAQIHRADEADP